MFYMTSESLWVNSPDSTFNSKSLKDNCGRGEVRAEGYPKGLSAPTTEKSDDNRCFGNTYTLQYSNWYLVHLQE